MKSVSNANLERIRERAATGACANDIAAALGLSPGTVRQAARQAGIALTLGAYRVPQARVDRIRDLGARGLVISEIAREMGLSYRAVLDIVQRRQIPVRRVTQEERARMAQARSGPVKIQRVLTAPSWVPTDLRGEYRDLASDLGHAWAEQAVRRLMAEAAR